jgi:uncharacterized RmlC-like cupin family protein
LAVTETKRAAVTGNVHGVTIVRGATPNALPPKPGEFTRATAFDFAGTGGRQTWIGRAGYGPGATTPAHHHGHHEVAVYVVSGRAEIRWGEHLDFCAQIGAGDLVYFAPFVPHQERNLATDAALEFVVVRSDNERITVDLDIVPVDAPTVIF